MVSWPLASQDHQQPWCWLHRIHRSLSLMRKYSNHPYDFNGYDRKCKYTFMCKRIQHVKFYHKVPDSKVHGAYMGPTWGRQDPGGPHVGPMNFSIRDVAIWWSSPVSYRQATYPQRSGRHQSYGDKGLMVGIPITRDSTLNIPQSIDCIYTSGPCFNRNTNFQCIRGPHYKDTKVARPSFLFNGNGILVRSHLYIENHVTLSTCEIALRPKGKGNYIHIIHGMELLIHILISIVVMINWHQSGGMGE